MNLPWEPAIYEHKAALIGLSPAEVSRSADLLARSLEAEHRAYAADFMTVGIDVYNIGSIRPTRAGPVAIRC